MARYRNSSFVISQRSGWNAVGQRRSLQIMRLSHVAWNLGGLAFPLGVAVLTVPHLIENLGQERFGLLALAWGLIGYAGTLDLGLGRALTQMVARLKGEGNFSSIPTVLATAGRITLVTGLIGGALIGF